MYLARYCHNPKSAIEGFNELMDTDTMSPRELFPIFVRQGRSPQRYKAGYINRDGAVQIEPLFDDAGTFSEGLATIKVGALWGAISPDGEIVIPAVSYLPLCFSEGESCLPNRRKEGPFGQDRHPGNSADLQNP